MIDDVLQKFTMSEARKNTHSRIQFPTTPTKATKKTSSHQVSRFNVPCHHHTHSIVHQKPTPVSKNKLQRMVEYLKENCSLRCPIKEHQGSKIRYICVDDSCSKNLGCAYCFLHGHAGHKKCEIQICIRDINDLNVLLNKSYDKITSGKINLRNEILKEIDLEINNLINQFHSNIQFLKNKAIKQIDNLLLQSSAPLTNLHQSYPLKETQQDLLAEIIRLDIKGMEKDLYLQLHDAEFQKMGAFPVIKLFQDMNSQISHIMAQFKQYFPKLNPYFISDQILLEKQRKKSQKKVTYIDQQFDDSLFENVAFQSPHFQS